MANLSNYEAYESGSTLVGSVQLSKNHRRYLKHQRKKSNIPNGLRVAQAEAILTVRCCKNIRDAECHMFHKQAYGTASVTIIAN
jgi:hypothetical protein